MSMRLCNAADVACSTRRCFQIASFDSGVLIDGTSGFQTSCTYTAVPDTTLYSRQCSRRLQIYHAHRCNTSFEGLSTLRTASAAARLPPSAERRRWRSREYSPPDSPLCSVSSRPSSCLTRALTGPIAELPDTCNVTFNVKNNYERKIN